MPSLTFTVSAAQAQRCQTAVGRALNLGRDATAAEVQQFMWQHMKDFVLNTESVAQVAALAAPADLGAFS